MKRNRLLIVSLGATVPLFLGVMAPAAQATAESTSTVKMAVVGDSYASAVGAGNYQPGTENGCWRSNNSYAEQIAANLRAHGTSVALTNVACSGATTVDVRQQQLAQVPRDVRYVLIQAGGNDAGFGAFSGQCVFADCSGEASDAIIAKMPSVRNNVTRLLVETQLRAPGAKLVLVGYGQILSSMTNSPGVPVDPICDTDATGTPFFTLAERIDTSRVSAKLDKALKDGAAVARVLGVDVVFVSPYQNDASTPPVLNPVFVNHSLCQAGVQYYHGLSALAPPPVGDPAGQTALLHWNVGGQTAAVQLIKKKVPALVP